MTPVSHLFVETKITTPSLSEECFNVPNTPASILVTRTGQAITIVNLSFYKPKTAIRVFNDTFLLTSHSQLTQFFRNPVTGELKEVFAFVVDNGPSEAPANLQVQMLLVRLMKFLNLHKATQRSLAEYLSKRNFVERVHAIENRALSKHGVFDAHKIHKHAETGSPEHKENMEAMAEDIVASLKGTTFGGKAIYPMRGSGDSLVFDDETELKEFGQLSDERRHHCQTEYFPRKTNVFQYLVKSWGVDEDFRGSYAEDYRTLTNARTASRDHYSVSIFREDENWRGVPLDRFQRRPLPDLIAWQETGKLHYLPFELQTNLHQGPWDELPELFLPSRVLDLPFKFFSATRTCSNRPDSPSGLGVQPRRKGILPRMRMISSRNIKR